MTVIGIDTAARVGGVAIVRDGRLLGGELFGVDAGHSEHLVPALARVMEAVGLEPGGVAGIAVSRGPGSFTGLRIGMAAAKALAYAWKVPLVGVSTLLATAWTYGGVDAAVCASLDARREGVYRAWYDGLVLYGPPGGDGPGAGHGPSAEDRPGAGDGAGEGDGSGEERVGIDEVAAEIERQLASGRRIVLVGDGSAAVRGAAARRLGRPEAELAALGVATAPLEGEAQRPANTALIGERELAMGRRDDAFALVPNYLRRSEAERRWLQRQS